MSSKSLVIPAAGSGKRMQRARPKPFIELNGQPILYHTIQPFLGLEGLEQIVVATSIEYLDETKTILAAIKTKEISTICIEGGSERQHSVYKALQKVADVDLVLVHDAVRPFVTLKQIQACCKMAEQTGAAVLGMSAKDTIKKVDADNFVLDTPDRRLMWQVQTPQVFKTESLKKAYELGREKSYFGTDDASLVEWMGEPVKVVKGSSRNIKITYPADLEYARILLNQQETTQ